MIKTAFISDLHLNPDQPEITRRFKDFLAWAEVSVQEVYILGDFFHAWSGDDSLDDWSLDIAKSIQALTRKGITVYYMKGNRDFLLGSEFARLAGWTELSEPTFIECDGQKVMLVHGDRYCTLDKAHQRLRRLTRNTWFPRLFLALPLKWRQKIVNQVRQHSQNKPAMDYQAMDVVEEEFLREMEQAQIHLLIHGHTHKPGEFDYQQNQQLFKRYVLSDWDDNPLILCYDVTSGFYFKQIPVVGDSHG